MKSAIFLLDTNVVSDVARGVPAVKNRFVHTRHRTLGVSTITLMETYYGLYRNPRQAQRVIQDIDDIFSSVEIIDFTSAAADATGRIRAKLESVGKPIGPYDLMIAGIALAHNLILVTGNTREFSRVPNLRLDNWRVPVNEVREERLPYHAIRWDRLDSRLDRTGNLAPLII